MQIERVAAIVLRQYYLLRGSVARMLPMFVWVTVDMILWGFMTRYLNSVASPGFDFVPTLLGAVLLWDFFARVMQGTTTAFFEDVWSRNFLNTFATPISIAEYLTGLVITAIATSLVALAVMLVLSTALFGLRFFSMGLVLAPQVLTLFLFGIALGIGCCGIVLRLGPAAEWFIWPIPAMLSPFVGVFYPLATLPPWMRAVSAVLPPSYVFESLRTVVSGGQASMTALLWSMALATGYIVLGCALFAHVHRHAVRTGLLARYSAETSS